MPGAEVIPIETRMRAASSSRPAPRVRCRATTTTGRPCRNYAVDAAGYCRVHSQSDLARSRHPSSKPVPAPEAATEADSALAALGDFLKRRLSGDYPLDDFGYDRDLSREVLLPLVRPIYERYFRVRTLGISRIPDEGAALLVGNHSGTVALDSLIMQMAVALEHPRERVVRNLGADLVYRLPFVGPMARKIGNAVACEDDGIELMRRGELLGVFPEGYKGVGKGWRERYRLQRFGRGGFIELAIKGQVPIIPVAIVGAEEAIPMIGNAGMIARAFGLPYFPITPTFPWLGPLGLLPFPSRWVIEFGDPIPTDEYPRDAVDDKMLVFDLADGVRDRIQQMLYKNLKFRGGAFI